jgi:hypothetical protein
LLFIIISGIFFYGCDIGSMAHETETEDTETTEDIETIDEDDIETDFEPPYPSGLPVMKIETAGRSIDSTETWLENAAYNLYDSAGALLSNGGMDIKGRGNTTWGMPKKPYSLKLAQKTSLLGMSEHKRWALLANYSDKTLLRTETAFELGYKFDNLAWTPHSVQVDLYLNGKYRGVYQLTEQIKIDTNRVNIDEIKKKNPSDGYILEIDVRKGEVFNFTTTRGVVFCCSAPDEDLDDIISGDTISLFEKIKNDVQRVEDVLYSDNFKDSDEGYRKYMDVGSFVDWYFVNEITKNNDAVFFSSVYMYYDPEKGKYCMGPIWDFDIALGNVNYNDNDNPEGFWVKDSTWISRLFEDPYFVTLVKNRWNEKRAAVNGIFQYIDDRVVYLNSAQDYNFKKWKILERFVWPNAVVTGTYEAEIAYMKSWLTTRLNWLDGAISGL